MDLSVNAIAWAPSKERKAPPENISPHFARLLSSYTMLFEPLMCSDSMVYWLARPLGIRTIPGSPLLVSKTLLHN